MNHLSQSFSLLFWLKKNRLKNNQAPIFARITIDGKRVEISTQKSVAPDKWNASAGHAKGNIEEVRTLNNYLNLLKGNLEKHHQMMLANQMPLTAQIFKNSYLGIEEKHKTLVELFEYHNKMVKERIGKEYADCTYKRFVVTIGKIKEYLQYHISDIIITELKYKFITDFEHFLKTKHNLEHNTAMKYIKIFKKVIRVAIHNEWLPKDPFAAFRCTSHEVH